MTVKKRPRRKRKSQLEDLSQADHTSAIALLGKLEDKTLDPKILTRKQRRACLAVVANGNHTAHALAHLFGVSSFTIRSDLKRIREELGGEVRHWSLDYVLGDLMMTADVCASRAMAEGDYGMAWKIKSESVKHLRELGVIGERKDQEGIRVTVEAIGQGYDKVRDALVYAMDPVLSGEEDQGPVIDVEARTLELPLNGRSQHPDEGHELEVKHPPA